MKEAATYVGMDAHKDSIFVAMLRPGEAPVEWQLRKEPAAVRRRQRKLQREATGLIACCYEAGPCGYTLQRQFDAAGLPCVVVASSLIPVKPGERIKTDRRDAKKLAELLRAELLTAVHPPTEDDEAVRDIPTLQNAARVGTSHRSTAPPAFILGPLGATTRAESSTAGHGAR